MCGGKSIRWGLSASQPSVQRRSAWLVCVFHSFNVVCDSCLVICLFELHIHAGKFAHFKWSRKNDTTLSISELNWKHFLRHPHKSRQAQVYTSWRTPIIAAEPKAFSFEENQWYTGWKPEQWGLFSSCTFCRWAAFSSTEGLRSTQEGHASPACKTAALVSGITWCQWICTCMNSWKMSPMLVRFSVNALLRVYSAHRSCSGTRHVSHCCVWFEQDNFDLSFSVNHCRTFLSMRKQKYTQTRCLVSQKAMLQLG